MTYKLQKTMSTKYHYLTFSQKYELNFNLNDFVLCCMCVCVLGRGVGGEHFSHAPHHLQTYSVLCVPLSSKHARLQRVSLLFMLQRTLATAMSSVLWSSNFPSCTTTNLIEVFIPDQPHQDLTTKVIVGIKMPIWHERKLSDTEKRHGSNCGVLLSMSIT